MRKNFDIHYEGKDAIFETNCDFQGKIPDTAERIGHAEATRQLIVQNGHVVNFDDALRRFHDVLRMLQKVDEEEPTLSTSFHEYAWQNKNVLWPNEFDDQSE